MGYPFIICFVLLLRQCFCSDYAVWKMLQENLLCNYSRTLRPVNDSNTSVAVQMNVSMINVFDLDVSTEIFTTSMNLDLTWTDERLFGSDVIVNDKLLSLSSQDVWIPQLSIWNTPKQQNSFENEEMVKVARSGQVNLRSEINTNTHCDINIWAFPFDKQRCDFKITLKHNVEDVYFTDVDFNWDNLVPSRQWSILNISTKTVIVFENSERRSGLLIHFYIKRYVVFYLNSFIFPMYTIFFVNPLVLTIKPKSGERISAAITLFLSFTVFLSLLEGILPGAFDSGTFLGMCLYAEFTLSALIVAYCIMIENLTNRTIVNVLGKFCVWRRKKIQDEPSVIRDSSCEDLAEKIISKLDRIFCIICFLLIACLLVITVVLSYS